MHQKWGLGTLVIYKRKAFCTSEPVIEMNRQSSNCIMEVPEHELYTNMVVSKINLLL